MDERVAGRGTAENGNLTCAAATCAAVPGDVPGAFGRRGFLGLCAAAGASCALALAGCGGAGESSPDDAASERDAGSPASGAVSDAATGAAPALDEVAPSVSDPAASGASDAADPVEALLSTLTLEQKVYQLFIVRPEALTGFDPVVQAGDATRAALEATPVGGLAYFAKNITGADQFTTMLANTAAMASPVPLFLAIDEEGGPLVARIANSGVFDVPAFPAMFEVGAAGDASAAFEVGDAIGAYLSRIGVNLDFARWRTCSPTRRAR